MTDWGDGGHWQPLAASLPGLILGGSLACQGAPANKMNLEEAHRLREALLPAGQYLMTMPDVPKRRFLCSDAPHQ